MTSNEDMQTQLAALKELQESSPVAEHFHIRTVNLLEALIQCCRDQDEALNRIEQRVHHYCQQLMREGRLLPGQMSAGISDSLDNDVTRSMARTMKGVDPEDQVKRTWEAGHERNHRPPGTE